MLELLQTSFMQRALLAALISGVLCPAVGTYIVQRRMSLLGDGLGHVAIAGVGLALLTGTAPLPVAIVVCLAGALIIELLRQSGHTSADVGLAILFYGGLAGGILFASLAGQGTGTLSQYLFGSLTTVTGGDLAIIAGLAVVTLIPTLGLAPQLFGVCVDEDYARTRGLRVRGLNILIVALAALTVTISMRTVGLLLVSALMVVPVATAQHLAGSFRATLGAAIVIGAVVSGGGTLLSGAIDTAPGATIVVAAIILFALSAPIGALLRRRTKPQETAEVDLPPLRPHTPAEETDAEIASVAVLHGDHVDFLHGTHLHHQHGDHFDEH